MELDTRPLRAANGAFHLGPVALSKGLRLCDFCFARNNGCGVTEPVERCGQIVPALSFISPYAGVEGEFSTFRPSSIWYDRAQALWKSHRTVGLIDAHTAGKLGHATILGAYRGKFADIIREHAWSNHLVKDLGLSKEDATAWLTKWISHNMGSRYVKEPDLICTVIYLRREA